MTVTGRGIWTPDDGDNFDFTVDLGAMAESIDLALGDVEDSALEEAQEGVPRRFNTLSALQAWTPADGAIGFVIADNRHYVRLDGQWKVALEDTGWLPINLTGGWTKPSASLEPTARMLDGVVHFQGVVANSSFTGGFSVIGSLPAGIPAPAMYTTAFVGMNFNGIWVGRVNSSGEIEMYRSTASGGWANLGALHYPVG